MALFIDSLAVMLIGLAMGLVIGAFYFFFKARGNEKQLESLIVPGFAVGFFNFVSGFIMSFTWPLPSGYNMLFGDPLLVFGLLMMASAYMLYRKMDLGLIPLLYSLLGIYVLVGAYAIVQYTLESGDNLITAMGLYISSGIGAVIAPIAYLKTTTAARSLYYVEWIILGVAAVFALVIGYIALDEHILDFAKWFP